MIDLNTGASVPARLTSSQALDAFHHIFDLTDWRLQIASLDPVSVEVEHDEAFADWVGASGSWKPSEIARTWVANRILDLVGRIDKSYIRSLNLQLPHSTSDSDTIAFLDTLRQQLELDIRGEMTAHFDTSISQWESDIRDFIQSDTNRELANRVLFYVGLDQVVSTDAVRKAIKMVFTRMHWHLQGEGAALTLMPDHRFKNARSRRSGDNETLCARSLVARAIEVIIDDHVRRVREGHDLAELSRACIRDTIEQRFGRDGVWGLIDMVIAWDRERYYLAPPMQMTEVATALIERQRVRLN